MDQKRNWLLIHAYQLLVCDNKHLHAVQYTINHVLCIDDIAVDWVSNKLYWTDSSWARIEALDLNSSVRVEVLRTGANTVPRAIAVDPINR